MTEIVDTINDQYRLSPDDFPLGGTLEQQWIFLLQYVILAPSTFNTQPWKFRVSIEGIEVYADYTRRMPIADPGNRELLMSIGAAITNLRVAASSFDIGCNVLYNTSGSSEEPIAFVCLTPHADLDARAHAQGELLPWILKRHTNRNPFLVSRVPMAVVEEIRDAAAKANESLFISVDGTLNERVANLVAQADELRLSDPEYRENLARWMRSQWTQTNDGVSGEALYLDTRLAPITAWTTKTLDAAKVRSARDRNLCLEAPGLIVICGEDAVPEWLAAGELLEHVVLALTRAGVQHGYFNTPLHVPELRTQLKQMLSVTRWPQLLLRVGYSLREPVLTPRRPVEDVLIPNTVF